MVFFYFYLIFRTVLSFTFFHTSSWFTLMKTHYFSKKHFYIQFTIGIYSINASIKPTFNFAIMKKDCIFFLGFILYLNITKFYMHIMQSFQLQTFLFFNLYLFLLILYCPFLELLELLELKLS